MNRSLNPFVSLAAALLLAACQSAPRNDLRGQQRAVAQPAEGEAVGTARRDAAPVVDPSAGTQGAPTAAGIADASAAPVPEQATQQYAVALKSMRAGQPGDAERQLKQVAAAYPTLSGPQLNLGLVYLQTGRLPEAEAAFKAVLERNPGNAVADNELGIVERKLGKFAEAEAAYQHAIVAAPNYAPAYLNLGVLYDLYLSDPKQALEQFEHYMTLAGDNKQVAGWVVELRKRVGAVPAAKKEPA